MRLFFQLEDHSNDCSLLVALSLACSLAKSDDAVNIGSVVSTVNGQQGTYYEAGDSLAAGALVTWETDAESDIYYSIEFFNTSNQYIGGIQGQSEGTLDGTLTKPVAAGCQSSAGYVYCVITVWVCCYTQIYNALVSQFAIG